MFRQMLHGTPEIRMVATATSEAGGISACELHKPDGTGVKVARCLAAVNPSAKVIILSGEASTFVCPMDLHPVVHAVLDKTQAFDDLAEELKTLLPKARGGSCSVHANDVRDCLSGREYEIFLLVGRGLMSKEIGEKLFISTQTVQSHRREMDEKLGTTGPEFTQLAIKHYQSTLGPSS